MLNQTLDESDGKCREVFVGKLPRDMFEDELLPKFEIAGPVFKIRLMMDFSGTNRGYGFIKFFSSADANYACKYIDGTLLRADSTEPIGVCPSFDNKSLFFGNIPTNVTVSHLRKELSQLLDGIQHIKLMFFKPKAKSRNATVLFKTHEAATQARRLLCPGNVKVFGRTLCVDWAKPDPPLMDELPATRTEAIPLLLESLEKLLLGESPSSSGASSSSTQGASPARSSPLDYLTDSTYPSNFSSSCSSSLRPILNTNCTNEGLFSQACSDWYTLNRLLN